jgi:glyoxylase-like metal-dependent hydrolase (beta-lactamase superfamily II)
MHMGDIEVRYLEGGNFCLDGGAMFGVVPKVFWDKKSPPDEKNRIRLRANSLLVRAHGKTIVIETGNGTKWDQKQRAIYAVQEGDPLVDSLAENGVQPHEVDLVINTHLHFDHAGGNTRIEKGRAVPAFPNARYVLQRSELAHATAPTERDRASYFPDNFVPLEAAGKLSLIGDDRVIAPGVELIRTPGHNADMMCVRLHGGGKVAFLFDDLIPMTPHLSLPWIMGYDLYPLQTLENKRKWIPQVVQGEWLALFVHDPLVPAAYLRERDGKIEVEPVKVD